MRRYVRQCPDKKCCQLSLTRLGSCSWEVADARSPGAPSRLARLTTPRLPRLPRGPILPCQTSRHPVPRGPIPPSQTPNTQAPKLPRGPFPPCQTRRHPAFRTACCSGAWGLCWQSCSHEHWHPKKTGKAAKLVSKIKGEGGQIGIQNFFG